MDPKELLAKFAAFLGIGAEDDGGAGEGDVSADESTSTDQDNLRNEDDPTDDADNTADGATGDEGGSSDDAADDNGDDGEQTQTASDVELAELRDSMTVIATENERLRTILTENGIDFEPAIEVDDGDDTAAAADAGDEYDDDAATADIAAQKARQADWEK